ncbi:MAG: adenylate/guanylate cyclase domain-containing protein [Shinella sp.]|nr:MAG: adenylate/guanylate cyclase domain-containing protein [Shinella sp.]
MASQDPLNPNTLIRSRPVQIILLAALVLALTGLIARLPAWALIDDRAFDYLSTLRAEPRPDDSPVIVAIDEPSLAEINKQWPWPRSLHGKLVSALRAAGARAIGLDIIFSEPSKPEEDAALAAALGSDIVLAGDETLVKSAQADQFIRVLPLQIFSDAGAQSGIASVDLGHDGVLRTMPDYFDGFAATLASVAGLAVETPPEGNRIQTFGGARTYPTVSYYQALDPEHFLPPGFFRDKVVIVGLSLQNAPTLAAGGTDAFATSDTIHTGKLTAGAEVHATIFDNLRLGRSISTGSATLTGLVLAAAALFAAAIVWRDTGWITALAGVAALIALVAGSYVTLRFGRVFVSPMAPALAFTGIAMGQAALDYAGERRSRRYVTRAFSQYLAPALVEQLARDPSRLKLGGEKRELSILFSDVRGFTTIAEQLKGDPQQLTTLINRLLTPLSDIVLAHNGTIDKYIGDCVMAFWNAPLDDADHAVNAVGAALAMLESMETLNLTLKAEAEAEGRVHYPLQIGAGINTGECVVGNMGSTSRFDYSALGDAVNLAARLEGSSKLYGVSLLLGEGTARAASHAFAIFELDRIRVKGKTEEVPVFTALRGTFSPEIRARHADFIAARYRDDTALCRAMATALAADIPGLRKYYEMMLTIPEADQA